VGDFTSFHNQFLNRPHPANKFKIRSQIPGLSKADEAIGCVVPEALGQIAPGYRPRCDYHPSRRRRPICPAIVGLVPAQRNARVVDASVTWTTPWLNIAFVILAILFVWRFPKTDGPATLRMMNRPAAMGPLIRTFEVRNYKNKFNWDYKTSPYLSPVIQSPPSNMSGNIGMRNAANPDNHQIELVANFRT
jgi:hypothetical protein